MVIIVVGKLVGVTPVVMVGTDGVVTTGLVGGGRVVVVPAERSEIVTLRKMTK